MIRRCAWLLLFCALPALAAPAPSPKGELSELRDRIKSLQKEVESAEGARADATDALKHSEQAISLSNRKLRELDQQQQGVDGEIVRLQQDSRRTQGSIGEHQARLSQLLNHLYIGGRRDDLEILLGQQNPEQLTRHLRYYTDISRARADLIRNLHGDLQHLRELADASRRKADELARIKAEQRTQKKQLEKDQGARKKLLSGLTQKIAGQRREIGRLQRDEKRLTQLVEKLAKLSARPPRGKKTPETPLSNQKLPSPDVAAGAFRQLKGRLHLPIRGELAHRYGSAREDGGTTWKGLFIRSSAGQEVKAIASGRVVFSDWLRGFGNIIIVDHGDSFMSLYGNNEALYKQAGEAVRAGDAIGAVGNSGGIPETGLYFEMRYQSRPFDPLGWVSLK